MQWKDSTTDPTLLGSMTEALNEKKKKKKEEEEEEEEEKKRKKKKTSYRHLLAYNKNRQIEGKRLHSSEVKIFYRDKPFRVGK